ncbi:MAG: quinolinate synthase NadA [Kiritimatiellaeota bacterium]|nr:quinolinate synthase NadA [Kiritimatiellota bacterium]
MKINDEEMKSRIRELRGKSNAVILAHNYQLAEAQEVADFVGDSLQLSIEASKTDADVILFCGVRFMAETAYILSPDKMVLLPSLRSGCPMADMAEPEELAALKSEHPEAIVVAYVNTSAEIKALSDICVTSSNAVAIVRSIPAEKEIIFVPDRNLGAYVARETGRKLVLWDGFCPTHLRISADDIKLARRLHSEAKVIVHPESTLDVIDLADEVLSTGGMLKFAGKTDADEIVVATEIGMLFRLCAENPDKRFYPATEQAVCPNMKHNRLEDILEALERMRHSITVPENIRGKALTAIERMLDFQ